MKTSHKILMAIALVSLTLVSALPIAINAKLRKGRYTYANTDSTKNFLLTPVKIISLNHLNRCILIKSDSFYLKVAKNLGSAIRFKNSGDTLSVYSENLPSNDSSKVYLYITSAEKIISHNSRVEIMGGFYGFHQASLNPSYHIELHQSDLSVKPARHYQLYNRVTVEGFGTSTLSISNSNYIQDLSLKNVNQVTLERRAQVKNIDSNFDAGAKVHLSSTDDGIKIVSAP